MRKQVSAMDPEKKAAHLLLHVSDVARMVCLPVGRDVFDNVDGAEQISRFPRERFAPDSAYSIFQDMAKFLYIARTDQNLDTFSMAFEMLRKKMESRMLLGPGPPGALVSALREQNAALPKNEKTAALACLSNALAFPQASAEMRRLFRPRGYALRRVVLVAQDMDTAYE